MCEEGAVGFHAETRRWSLGVTPCVGSPHISGCHYLYFAKRPLFAPEGVLLASKPLDYGTVWKPVDGHSWIEIDPGEGIRGEGLLF